MPNLLLKNKIGLVFHITGSSRSDSANLFIKHKDGMNHVSTIISGSRSNLELFSATNQLIEKIPEMIDAIHHLHVALEEFKLIQIPEFIRMKKDLSDLINRLETPLKRIHR